MIRRWLKKLEREAKDEEAVIPLDNGTEARFPQSALKEAFVHELGRLRGEHDEVHPLTVAMTRSSDSNLRQSAHAAMTEVADDGNILPPEEVEDLSE